MKIIRVTHPEGIDLIKKQLGEPTNYDPDEYAEGMKRLLKEDPRNTCFLLAFEQGEEDKEPTVLAFILGYASPDQSYAWVWQAWSSRQGGVSLSKRLWYRFVLWTHNMGKDHIRMETQRNPKTFTKRYGFEVIANVMEYNIPEDFEESLIESQETSDGK